MLFVALALIAFGLVFGLMAPPFGFAPIVVGLIVLLVYVFAGVGKRVAD